MIVGRVKHFEVKKTVSRVGKGEISRQANPCIEGLRGGGDK